MGVPEECLPHAPKPSPPGGNDRQNVFLSHRSANRAWVTNLYNVLQELG
jgi:hypothetical protein